MFLVLLGDKLSEEDFKKLVNLPYCSSVTEFEELFEKIKELELPAKTKDYYKNKYKEKGKWCMAFKKALPCLKINTTSRLEGLNSIIKKEINSSSHLVELFYRLIDIFDHSQNTSYSDCVKIHSQLLENLEANVFLKNFKELLSPYAYSQIALNLSQAFSYDVKLYGGILKVKHPTDQEICITKSQSIECKCKYFMVMGLLCPHLIAIGMKYKEINLKGCIRDRWMKYHDSASLNDSNLVDFIRNYLMDKRKVNLSLIN